MSKPSMFIHIGTHKTGSTAIQNMLRCHQHALGRSGLFTICPHLGFESLMASDTIPPRLARDFSKCVRAQMRTYPKQSECRYVTSWEGYCGNPKKNYQNAQVLAEILTSALDDVDIRIIIYLRRQDTFLESLYTQMIHEGESYSFQEFTESLGKDAFDWNRLLDTYGKAFGRENLVVRRFGKEFLPEPQSLLVDFFNIFGIDAQDLPRQDSSSSNRGYSRAALETARLCNPGLSNQEREILRGILQETGARKPGEEYSFMSYSERIDCLERYRASNEKIANEFFQGENSLFSIPSSNIDESLDKTMEIKELFPVVVNSLMKQKASIQRQSGLRNKSVGNPTFRLMQQKLPGLMFKLRNQLLKAGII